MSVNEQKHTSIPDPIDIHVGARLRLRRNLAGISQEQLGKASNLTFQQIQKYERGANRMGASRLYRFAKILNVPVSYFFEEMPHTAIFSNLVAGFAESEQEKLEGEPNAEKDMFSGRETLELIRAYYRISDVKQRRKIFELIKSMADDNNAAAAAQVKSE